MTVKARRDVDRWDIERALQCSELPAPARHILLTLCTRVAVKTGVKGAAIPAAHTPSITDLVKATGLSRAGVAKHLIVLEASGWLTRTVPPVAKARAEHARTRYRLTIPEAVDNPGKLVHEVDQASPPRGLALVHEVDQASPRGGLVLDLKDLQTKAAARATPRGIIKAAVPDVSDADADAIVEHIQATRQPRNAAGLIRTMARDGDLTDVADEVLESRRDQTNRAAVAALLAAAGRQPECKHGQPGGDAIRPDTGKPVCAQCRHAHNRDHGNGNGRHASTATGRRHA